MFYKRPLIYESLTIDVYIVVFLTDITLIYLNPFRLKLFWYCFKLDTLDRSYSKRHRDKFNTFSIKLALDPVTIDLRLHFSSLWSNETVIFYRYSRENLEHESCQKSETLVCVKNKYTRFKKKLL